VPKGGARAGQNIAVALLLFSVGVFAGHFSVVKGGAAPMALYSGPGWGTAVTDPAPAPELVTTASKAQLANYKKFIEEQAAKAAEAAQTSKKLRAQTTAQDEAYKAWLKAHPTKPETTVSETTVPIKQKFITGNTFTKPYDLSSENQ
jgi:hypothetical protein